ncbi:MAG: hypothetical protein ACNA7X_00965 [Dehalococcoidia bacterium]
MAYREPTREDHTRTAIYLVLYIAVLSGGAFLLMPGGAFGAAAWAVIVVIGAFLLIRWHARNTAYRCRECHHEFEISILTDAISPHGTGGGGWKYLRCPQCDRRTRAQVLIKE